LIKKRGNSTEKESYEEIVDYLEGKIEESLGKVSLAGLDEALNEVLKTKKSSEETGPSKVKPSEKSSTENVPTNPSTKPEDGLSPIN